MSFEIVPAYDRREQLGPLFDEYMQMLVETDPLFAKYLDLQNYDEEIDHLEEKYGSPRGRLYLALTDGGEAAGSIALHPLDEERCELKRLYVRPAFRGSGLGERLVDLIIDDARSLGYRRMLLDTLTPLKSAIRIYRAKGFYEIPCYNDSPMIDTLFLQLDL